MVWLLIGYMWLFIHRPDEIWPMLGAIRIVRVYMIVVIGYWLVAADKSWVSNRLNVAFAAFFLAIITAWVASPYAGAGDIVIEEFAKVGVFYVLVMSQVRDERNLRLMVVAVLACIALSMLHSLWEYRNGRHIWVTGTARMIGLDKTLSDPNSFAASLIYVLPLTIPFWSMARSSRDTLLLLAYTALTTVCVLLTGSRTGFVGLMVVALALVLISRHRAKLALAMLVLAPVAWGLLPADRQNRFLTLLDPSYGPANAQQSAESRKVFFDIAFEQWQQSPLLGNGPDSFRVSSGTGMAVHSLYGQLFAEVGLVGMLAFAGVLACFVLNARDISQCYVGVPWQQRGFPFWLSTAVLVSVLLLLVQGLGGHNLLRYNWLWFGAFQAIALKCAREQGSFLHADSHDFNWSPTIDPCSPLLRGAR